MFLRFRFVYFFAKAQPSKHFTFYLDHLSPACIAYPLPSPPSPPSLTLHPHPHILLSPQPYHISSPLYTLLPLALYLSHPLAISLFLLTYLSTSTCIASSPPSPSPSPYLIHVCHHVMSICHLILTM